MKKTACCALLAGGLFVSTVFALPKNLGPEKMIILTGGSLGDVPFSHRDHQTNLEDCNVCHRLFPQKPGIISKMKAEGTLKNRAVMDQCRDCHRKRAAQGKATGPTGCASCHSK